MINQFQLGAFYLLGAIIALLGVILTVVCATCSDLIKQEASTRLERLPLRLLERASQALPEECRDQIMQHEWMPELLNINRYSEGMPITRLVKSLRFAISLMGTPAANIGRDLGLARGQEHLPKGIETHPDHTVHLEDHGSAHKSIKKIVTSSFTISAGTTVTLTLRAGPVTDVEIRSTPKEQITQLTVEENRSFADRSVSDLSHTRPTT